MYNYVYAYLVHTLIYILYGYIYYSNIPNYINCKYYAQYLYVVPHRTIIIYFLSFAKVNTENGMHMHVHVLLH